MIDLFQCVAFDVLSEFADLAVGHAVGACDHADRRGVGLAVELIPALGLGFDVFQLMRHVRDL